MKRLILFIGIFFLQVSIVQAISYTSNSQYGSEINCNVGATKSVASVILYSFPFPTIAKCPCDIGSSNECGSGNSLLGNNIGHTCYDFSRKIFYSTFKSYIIKASISNTSGKKEVPITNNLSAPQAGNFNCEEHGYYSGNWSHLATPSTAWILKGTNYSCPSDQYASQIECAQRSFLTYSTRPCTTDGVGWTRYRVYCKLVDDTPPVPSDLTISPSDQSYLVANATRTVTVSMNPQGGSPGGEIRTRIENKNNKFSFSPSITQNPSIPFSASFDTSRVDGVSDRTPRNYRPYTFQIEQVCDEAGNCIAPASLPVNRIYNIYANDISLPSSTLTSPTDLTSGVAVADGNPKNYSFTLRDIYGNTVVPTRRADNSLLRSVEIGFNHNVHTLGINQYNTSSTDGALEFQYNSATEQPNKGDAFTSFIDSDVGNNTGIYAPALRVYTPTGTNSPLYTGDVTLNSVQVKLSDFSPATLVDPVVRNLNFKPLYSTLFSGALKTTGFIEGASQSSSISVIKNSSVSTSGAKLHFEFGSGSSNQISSGFNLKFGDPFTTLSQATEGNQIGGIQNLLPAFKTLAGTQSYPLSTLLIQEGASPVSTLSNSYLSSHIQYTLDGKIISYNSDVVAKNSYFDNLTATGNTFQQGLKVLGLTSSDKNQELTLGQFSDDVRIVGKVTKSTFRRDITKKVFETIRSLDDWSGNSPSVDNLNGATWSISLNEGKNILGDTVQVFKNLNGRYTSLGDATGTMTTYGRKTLVVVGGDVYIRENITASGDAILGIIALRDNAGKGGNIYIDPRVTDLHAVIYADRSLFSASDINSNGTIEAIEIFGASTPVSVLANQLYIKGSVFSENTIGGSRSNPVECPYYTSCTTSEEAQIYDLNYMRRYSFGDHDNNILTPKSIANGGVASAGAGTSYTQYPFVIEYNPNIQTDPPEFFY